MIVLDVIRKIRQRLRAVAEAKPAQWHSGTAMLRFLALMFLLTLLVRGTAASTIPVVTVTAPYQGVVTQSFTVSGQMSPGAGTPLTVPEGLLIEQVLVQSGDSVTKGQALALLSLDDIRTEIDQVQASIQQHQVQANQLMEGETADSFAWQQAQQQLDRAYTNYQQTTAEGEEDVSQAQDVLDAARQSLADVESENRNVLTRTVFGRWQRRSKPRRNRTTQIGRRNTHLHRRLCNKRRSNWKRHRPRQTVRRRQRCPPRKVQRILATAPSTIMKRKRTIWPNRTRRIERVLKS